MNANQIRLETKLVCELSGKFFVPSYQRGYRWGEDEVLRLLNDVYTNGRNPYCLQPIVVLKQGGHFVLIDGQQRLTTIYLIYRYLYQMSPNYYDPPRFSLKYETRERSEEFLESMDFSRRNEYIDFWFMANAYKTIEKWFLTEKRIRDRAISECFDLFTRVIWYEVGKDEDAISLFTRLNIGKIPLTSSELVKAMFLSSKGKEKGNLERQEEISLQWDNMERELHNESLWYFLTNQMKTGYQTRIDLVLDLIAEKPAENREKYDTFFKIDELGKTMGLEKLWKKIRHTFLVLKDWYENHELYHKIGYLIASEELTLLDIYQLSLGKTKREFRAQLDEHIRKSIEIQGNYAELSYEKSTDYKRLSTLLLLFNVESVRKNGDESEWFPFDRYKYDKNGRVAWSLEHIHAQQSEGLRTQEMWKEWLSLHLPSIRAASEDVDLISAMQEAISKPKLERNEFDKLQQRVIELLSVKGSKNYLHSIGNLALLKTSDNAALNNSTFDVKRNRIVQMDKEGEYIPFCTKMVFLKYYTPSAEELHFWGQADRAAYINAINEVLQPYGLQPIQAVEEAQ